MKRNPKRVTTCLSSLAIGCLSVTQLVAADPHRVETEEPAGQRGGGSPGTDQMLEAGADFAEPQSMTRLPVEDLVAVEARSGDIILVSGNGRYIIEGDITDMWLEEPVEDAQDLKKSVNVQPLQGLGLDPEQLGAVTFGDSGKDVAVFSDPRCKHCGDVFDQIPELSEDYQVHVVKVPALGSDSVDLVQRFHCEENEQAKKDAVLSHDYSDLQPADNCTPESIHRAAQLSDGIGIDAVPTVIDPYGQTHRGAPEDMAAWLDEASETYRRGEETRAGSSASSTSSDRPSLRETLLDDD